MLPNIDRSLYARFITDGYRIRYAGPIQTLDEIVHLGYLDVCRRLAGITSQQSHSFKQPAVSFIRDVVARAPKTQEEFDSSHHQCCEQCLAASSDQVSIHYGQAQKLLNMSLKYLYNEFAAYYGTVNQFGFPEDNVERFFHLPIDNQILDYLTGHHEFSRPAKVWTMWNYDEYLGFQRQCRNRISTRYQPLEIDYLVWNTPGASLGNAIR